MFKFLTICQLLEYYEYICQDIFVRPTKIYIVNIPIVCTSGRIAQLAGAVEYTDCFSAEG